MPLIVVLMPPDIRIVTEGLNYSKPPELTTPAAISARPAKSQAFVLRPNCRKNVIEMRASAMPNG
jgi:hypothetical protein